MTRAGGPSWRAVALVAAVAVPVAAIEYRQHQRLQAIEVALAALEPVSSGGSTAPTAILTHEPIPPLRMSTAGAVFKGSDDAPVVMLEFSDFTCGHCARFTTQVLPAVEREYITAGRIRLGFRTFLLGGAAGRGLESAVAAVCANRQSAFWPMHRWLFREPPGRGADALATGAASLGLEMTRFRACVADTTVARHIEDLSESARRLGVSSTPTFLIGRQDGPEVLLTRRINGAQPIEVYRAALDSALRDVSQ